MSPHLGLSKSPNRNQRPGAFRAIPQPRGVESQCNRVSKQHSRPGGGLLRSPKYGMTWQRTSLPLHEKIRVPWSGNITLKSGCPMMTKLELHRLRVDEDGQ